MTTNSITGRDRYIQGQALIYAVSLIQSQVVTSNCLDMCEIVRTTMSPLEAAMSAADVVSFYNLRPDIDPENEAPEYKARFEAALDQRLATIEDLGALANKAV